MLFAIAFHAHVQLRILSPLLDWKRCSSSQSSSFSVIRTISTKFLCGLWVFSPLHLVRDLIALFLHAACSVAIHLVRSNANLFLSRKIVQLRSILSVFRSYCNLLDGRHAVLRVSSVVSLFNCRQSAKLFKRTGRSQRKRLCFRKTSVICSAVCLIIIVR